VGVVISFVVAIVVVWNVMESINKVGEGIILHPPKIAKILFVCV
jgi:hypothetical protein